MKIRLNRPPLVEYGLCLLYSVGWLIALSVTGYPVGDWIGVVVVAYLTFAVSRFVVGGFVLQAILVPFNRHWTRVLNRLCKELGLDLEELLEQARSGPAAWSLGALLLFSCAGAVIGFSLILTHLVMGWAGFSSLGPAFSPIALWMLGVSAVAFTVVVSLPHLIYRRIDALLNDRSDRRASLKSHSPSRLPVFSRVWPARVGAFFSWNSSEVVQGPMGWAERSPAAHL